MSVSFCKMSNQNLSSEKAVQQAGLALCKGSTRLFMAGHARWYEELTELDKMSTTL